MKKGKLKSLLIISLLIALIPFNTKAQERITLNVDKTEVKANDTVTVTVDLDSNQSLYAFTSSLSFDENVFEVLQTENFKELDDWSDITYNSENNKFALLNKSGETNDHLLTIKLFVKANPKGGNTEISLKNSVASDGIQDIEFNDAIQTLDVDGVDIPSSYTQKTEETTKNVTAENYKPHLVVCSILVVVLFILIMLINSRKLRNKLSINYKTANIILTSLLAVSLLGTIVLAVLINNRGDVNDDGKKDYEDAKAINKYLIDITNELEGIDDTIISSETTGMVETANRLTNNLYGKQTGTLKLKNTNNKNNNKYDVNGDGKVTITDSASQTKDTTDKKYKVELTKGKFNQYPNKNSNVTLNFTAKINPNNAKIKEVYIDGKKVKVSESNNKYSVTVKTKDKSGILKYTITKVVLNNKKEIDTKDLTFTVDVLKNKPTVTDFNYKSSNISFNLKDSEKTLKKAHIKIVKGTASLEDLKAKDKVLPDSTKPDNEDPNIKDNDEFDTNQIVFEKDLDVNVEKITNKVSLVLGETYTVLITGDYDLDTNKLDKSSNYYENKELYYSTFTNGEVVIKPITNLDTLYPEQGKTINFQFDATVKLEEITDIVKTITIDGVDRNVDYVDGHYIVVLDGVGEAGEKNHTISSIILENGQKILCHYEFKYDVLKQVPTIENFVYHDTDKRVTFELNDKDRATKNATIIITSQDNKKVVLKKEMDLSNLDFTYDANLYPGKYDVEITGTYDLDSNLKNGKNEGELLYNHELTVHNVKLTHVDSGIYYANRGENTELKFKVAVEPEDDAIVTDVLIKDKDTDETTTYHPTRTAPGTYSVDIEAPNAIGEHKYGIEKITLNDDEVSKNLDFTIDVLRKEPFVENLYIDETLDTPIIRFNLNDAEESFKNGDIAIKDKDKEELRNGKVVKGDNTIQLSGLTDLNEGGTYYLDINVDYDLDSDKDSENNADSKLLVENHEIKIYKAKLSTSGTHYASKGDLAAIPVTAKINSNDDDSIHVRSFIMSDDKVIDASYEDGLHFNIEAPKEAKEYTYNVKEVILSNDIKVKAPLEFKLEVLKDEPYINKLYLNESNNALSYELVDKDSAFKSGTLYIYNNGLTVNNPIVNNQKSNTVNYNFIEEQLYDIKVVGNYQLDINGKKLFNDKEMSKQSFMIGGSYNFEITDVSITDTVHKDKKPVISFVSTNSKKLKVNKVTVSGKEYTVKNVSGDNYEVTIDNANMNFGKHDITLDSVKLSNNKTYNNNSDYKVDKLTYTVLKDAPSVTDIKLSSDAASKTVTANFKVKDDNYSLTNLAVVLVDSSAKILDTKYFTAEQLITGTTLTTSLSYDKNKDGAYTVKFLADYQLGDKYKYNSQNIGQQNIFVENHEIYIDEISFSKGSKYALKGQRNFEISYDVHVGANIKTNNGKTYTRLSGIMVNGTHYVASSESTKKASTYKAKIGIVAPSKAGVYKLTANRVQLELNQYYDKQNDYYSVPSKDITIEVLKDVPRIENLKITNEDYNNKTVTFEFDVKLDETAKANDNSFANGKVEFNGETKSFTRDGRNTVTFSNVEQDKISDLVFKADYDLDTDTLNANDTDKNEYTNETIYSVKYGLFNEENYDDIKIANGKAISEKDNNYFEKNEKIKLHFDIQGISSVNPSKVKIDDKEYTLSKVDDSYEITLDGYNQFGEKTIEITDVILENGKVVKLKTPYVIKPEVLKDAPKVTDYDHKDTDSKITLSFNLKDYDGAIAKNAKVKITDEDGKVLYNKDFEKQITIDRDKNVLRYYVSVVADYDRDIDISKGSDNYFSQATLLEETISFDKKYIELKDINDINLYKSEIVNGQEKIELKDEINKDELKNNKDKYFVEINMEQMPSVRSKIKSIEEKDNHLILVLDYQYVTLEDSNETTLKIDYGEIKNGVVTNETHPDVAFKNLLAKLENGDSVTLNKNYDASSISVDGDTYIKASYSGKLDGNGYTIENLKKPLFEELTGEVKDLTLKHVNLDDKRGKGSLAIQAIKAKINGVIVDDLTKSGGHNGNNQNGGLVGLAKNSTIEHCGMKNIVFNAGNGQQNGLLVGASDGSFITDNYVIGTLNGSWNFNGGLIGSSSNSTVLRNYVKATVGGAIACELACGGSGSTYKDNISLSSTAKNGFATGYKSLDNNYRLMNEEIESTTNGIINITKQQVNQELFKKANFDEDMWRLNNNTSYTNPPIFKTEKITDLKGSNNKNFNEDNIILYNNLMKLMPFYKADEIIETASHITNEKLQTKEISHILPVDSNGNIVTYLTSDNAKKISKIKVVYKDNTKAEYKVKFDNVYDMVANYRIPELKLDYNYNHYVISAKSQIVNDLTNYLKGLNYTENLDTLTSSADSRIYKDFYNEITSKELKEFVLKFLSNSNYTSTDNEEQINAYIERAVKKDNTIEKVLYTYNYFRRFYDLKIDGMKLYDFMMFRMDGFDKSLTPNKIAELYFADASNFNTGSTGTKYAAILGKYTNQDTIAKFLEYMVTEFGDGDLDEWTRKQFKGYLVELPVEGMEDKIQYTLWDHFSNEDKNYKPHRAYDMMLPILTLPRNAAYIISTPVQYVIGAQRSYIENPEDPKQQDILRRRIKSYADRMTTYYSTAYNILKDPQLFNDIHTFHLDKRYAYDENGAMVYQQVGTEEPFHKNFNEVTGRWQTSDGNAAVAWGDRIDWSAEGLMDGYIDPELAKELNKPLQEYTYHTFTHETAHNIDARLFLKNHGRRFDAGGEDYADSNLMQSFGPNDIVMNLSVTFEKGSKIGSSWTPDRIDTPLKIKDYYDKVFQTIYVMDYIEAQAFLQLSNEDKAEIGIQITYPNEEKYQEDGNKYRARQTTGFNQRSVEEWSKMQLNSINDLIDNKIMKYAGVYKYASRGSNSYGGEGINTAHWYQPNNPDGRPDSYALKWIAYEMLGYKGYQDGYIEYNSNIHSVKKTIYKNIDKPSEGTTQVDYKTDNMAIQRISDGKYKNIDEYKKARFKEVEQKLPYLKTEINVKDYVQKLYDALVKDAESTRVDLANKMQNNPNCLNDYWCRVDVSNRRSYPKSTEVRQEIYYKLKNLTDDFVGEIYATTPQQDVSNLKVNKGN